MRRLILYGRARGRSLRSLGPAPVLLRRAARLAKPTLDPSPTRWGVSDGPRQIDQLWTPEAAPGPPFRAAPADLVHLPLNSSVTERGPALAPGGAACRLSAAEDRVRPV